MLKNLATRQKIILYTFAALIVISIAFVLYTSFSDPSLPFGVDGSRFQEYLDKGDYQAAADYWDRSLVRHSDETSMKRINNRFSGMLSEHLLHMDVYCGSDRFSVAGFNSRYGNITLMGDRASKKLLIIASKAVIRYANQNMTYGTAKNIINLMCDMLDDEVSRGTILTALDAYEDVMTEFERGQEFMQCENYMKALVIMENVCVNTDEKLYLHYIAQNAVDKAVEELKVEADTYAGDRDYARAAEVLIKLNSIYDDAEAKKMLKRVNNIMHPQY